MMKNIFATICVVLMISACEPVKPNTQLREETPMMSDSRVVVTRIGIFRDDLAYDRARGIYIIKDSKTGQEFIGISGVGIAETGNHRSGKSTVSDER